MNLGFLGAGKMAEAIFAGALRSGALTAGDLTVCEQVAERRAALKAKYDVATAEDAAALMAAADTVVLAVKPQDLQTALEAIAPHVTPNHLLVSIAAGWTLARLEAATGGEARVVRVMPNLPILVGEGMSAYAPGSRARKEDGETVQWIFSRSGQAMEVPEALFDAVTALSGSGPAFFAYALRAFTAAAEAGGMPQETAARLGLQTLLGTAKYLAETGQAPDAFIAAVASPKGTTEAGLEALDAAGADAVLRGAIKAASARSAELSRQ